MPAPAQKPEQLDTVYLRLDGADAACADKVVAALSAGRTVRDVKADAVIGEAVVTVVRGTTSASALARIASQTGCKASEQEKDTWCLKVASGDGMSLKDAARSVEGVVAVQLQEGGILCVTAYTPHVTTGQLLTAILQVDPEAKVQTETLRLQVKGADSAEKCKEVARLLKTAAGVVEAEVASGEARIVREQGRAALDRLNRAIESTGCKVEAAG